jgi:hypothetical protein
MKINITNLTPALSKAIQEFLIVNGFRYPSRTATPSYTEKTAMGIDTLDKKLYCGTVNVPDETINAPSGFGRIVELVSEGPVKIRLNGSYHAEVSKDKVVVGCQTFEADRVLEVAEKINELRK